MVRIQNLYYIMIEEITKAEQGAQMLESDLREALAKADPISEIIIRKLLEDACFLHFGLRELSAAQNQPTKP